MILVLVWAWCWFLFDFWVGVLVGCGGVLLGVRGVCGKCMLVCVEFGYGGGWAWFDNCFEYGLGWFWCYLWFGAVWFFSGVVFFVNGFDLVVNCCVLGLLAFGDFGGG